MYRCFHCDAHFQTISGLCSHVASGKCDVSRPTAERTIRRVIRLVKRALFRGN
jgi:hypothetical protein